MNRYAERLKKVSAEFDRFKLVKIDRTINSKADSMAKLATTSRAVDLRSIVLIGSDRTILGEGSALEVLWVDGEESWMTEIEQWLSRAILPNERNIAKSVQSKALRFYWDGTYLYKRGFKGPDLRCINPAEDKMVID